MKHDFFLSPHFRFSELTKTEHRDLVVENIQQALPCKQTLEQLCHVLLEPIRRTCGALIVHSGFRMPELNTRIGGSKTSQHMKGEAADFHWVGGSLQDVFDWIWIESDLPYGQVILEGGTEDDPAWIHISLGEPYRVREKCRQALRMLGGKYTLIHQG